MTRFWLPSFFMSSFGVQSFTLSTSSSPSSPLPMSSLMRSMHSTPTSVASLPPTVLPSSLLGGRYFSSPFPFPSSYMFITSATASSSFIFMKGHVAQPPLVPHPSPPATPGTIPPSAASSIATASEATGNTISASTRSRAPGTVRRISLTFLTTLVTIPASVPSMNLRVFLPSPISPFAASSTFLVMKLRMSEVDPVTPRPWSEYSMAISNISPGTSR
mmetsp:Transcript_20857/g.43537  ORF Transcript_20857/g.43537 Transcript_20857/m.43537 type:complete len:218 (-) Transcript_20857:1056-1709(-)